MDVGQRLKAWHGEDWHTPKGKLIRDVVYAMEKEGTTYARFGRIRGLPGDEVGAREGRLTVNGEPIGPIPIPGEPMGTVPPGKVLILATNPAETRYPDSRVLGFIPRANLRAVIRYRIGG